MGRDIDGLLEVKRNGKWEFLEEIDFEGTRDSTLWCYMFGINCGRFDKYDDKYHGIYHNYEQGITLDTTTLSDESKELMDSIFEISGPFGFNVKDLDRFKYFEEVEPPYNDGYSEIYDHIFDKMKTLVKKGDVEDVRCIVWYDY